MIKFRIIITFFFLALICVTARSQYLEIINREKNEIIEGGILNSFIAYRNDNQLLTGHTIGFTHIVPYLAYKNDNIYLGLAYNNFSQDKKDLDEIYLNGYYGMNLRLSGNASSSVLIPILIRTAYLKVIQKNNGINTRLEIGNFGPGVGLKFKQNLSFCDLIAKYHFIFNYSTINFSVDYGYSLYNEFEISLNFHNVTDIFGISVGVKYMDERWYISNETYNYFGSWAGGYLGIIF